MITVLFLDTCVWLELAKNKKDESIISIIEELAARRKIILLVPQLVIDEFNRNKNKVAEATTQRFTQEIKLVRKLVQSVANETTKDIALNAIDDVNHRLPLISDSVYYSIDRIEQLFVNAKKIIISNSIKIEAANRAIECKAPFHKNKNSMDDALLIEAYGAFCKKNLEKEYSFKYVTYNVNDFSDPNDNRKCHKDLAEFFLNKKSKYYINIVDAVRDSDKIIFEEFYAENEWSDETRGLREIIESLNELTDKIWYGRHGSLAESVKSGTTKVIPNDQYKGNDPKTIKEEIWIGACNAAKKVELKYPNDVGPWDDFEWGMLNGKLSALRWVLGDDWDMLDT